ncbi:ATP-binding protein [Gaoshiqia sp. Z1-71]|uniref:ATP-binding protein n=1 Tax=Gaoshiqia hydrogeniformans TaxID=3290090 RepID=UPI003BF891FA
MKVLNSIRARLIIPIVLFSLSLLTITIVFLGQRQLRDVRQNVINQNKAHLQLIAEYVSVPLIFDQPEDAMEVLSKLENIKSILSASIYTADGDLFAFFGQDSVKQPLPDNLNVQEISLREESMYMTVPIVHRTVTYGTLMAKIDLHVQWVLMKELFLLFLLVFVSMGILSVAVAFLFERKFLKPILLLAEKFREVTVARSFLKPLSPLQLASKSSNEVEILIAGYNKMISTLALREKKQAEAETALKEINEELESKVAERTNELEKAHAKLQKLYLNEKVLLENLPYGIILTDHQARVVEMNNFAKELLGFTHTAPAGISAFCKDDYWAAADSKNTMAELFSHTRQSFFRNSKGEEIPVLKTVVPIIYNHQEVIMEAFVDITDLQNVQKELVIAKEKAEESDRLKSSFLANMSHEIRTPLNAIVGFASMLVEEDFEQKEKDLYKQIIEENTASLLNLIEDILDLSRLESGTLTMCPENVDIAAFSEDIYNNSLMMQARLNKTGCNLTLDLQTDQAETGYFDSLRMKQVALNLINNAIKFTDEGSITFGIKSQGNRLLFYVKDTGIGIGEKFRGQVFERFHKTSDSNEKLYKGTGLGLAISKSLVELSGGEIWFESEPGQGTTFFFTVPQKKAV